MKSPFPKVGLGQEKGFTLIELIMVIVLLGILAAVAIPKYQDLRTEASQAACDGVYGAVQGAAAVNFATRLVSPSKATEITDGNSLVASLQGGAPVGWTAAATLNSALVGIVGSRTCVINITTAQTDNTMAAFGKSGF
jgi:MSHA pilin protein MshA